MAARRNCFAFTTKAVTLRRLAARIKRAQIDEGALIGAATWRGYPGEVLSYLAGVFGFASVIVRSSTVGEDSWERSEAGRFDSIVVTQAANRQELRAAIRRVIASYEAAGVTGDVFVQCHLTGVALSAVATTRVAGTGAPYRVIALDVSSGRTHKITSGTHADAEIWYVQRSRDAARRIPKHVKEIVGLCQELESVTGTDRLDIEVVVDNSGEVHLLQVRPLVLPGWGEGRVRTLDRRIAGRLARCHATGRHRRKSWRTGTLPIVYSNMADWNPAEMLGLRPRPLALTLYRALITDRTWAVQRHAYGYMDLRGTPLLVNLGGIPYVDVGASLASFLPATLSSETAATILEAQLRLLTDDRTLHDKLEFEVAFPSLPLGMPARERLSVLGLRGGRKREFLDSLRILTTVGIERLAKDLATLERWRASAPAVGVSTEIQVDLRSLVAATRGVALNFAHIARSAFLATAVLRDLAQESVIGGIRLRRFMRSLGTVTDRLLADGIAVGCGTLAWKEYVDRYGHLRPGTYEITVPAYSEAPEVYLRSFVDRPGRREPGDTRTPWSRAEATDVGRILREERLPVSEDALSGFCQSAIVAREEAKFIYSRWISAILETIDKRVVGNGLTRDDASFLTLHDLLSDGSRSPRWRHVADRRRDEYEVTSQIELPACVVDNSEVLAFKMPSETPTFVGANRVTSRPVVDPEPGDEIDGVVVLERADPGWDWLFGHATRGIVTQVGGANSHMAVRCAELGVPAALGVGELVHRELLEARVIELDARRRIVRAVG